VFFVKTDVAKTPLIHTLESPFRLWAAKNHRSPRGPISRISLNRNVEPPSGIVRQALQTFFKFRTIKRPDRSWIQLKDGTAARQTFCPQIARASSNFSEIFAKRIVTKSLFKAFLIGRRA
jgi:hypothetical protein